MKRLLPLVLLVGLLGIACQGEKAPETPPAPPPPPPPTAAEIAQEIRTPLQPLMMGQAGGEAVQQAINHLQTMRSKHQVTDNGRQALATVERELKDALKQAYDNGRWGQVTALCDVVQSIDAQYQPLARYRERAHMEQTKPRLTLKGFFEEPNSKTIALLSIYFPETHQTVEKRAYEGEEFNDMQFVEVIGQRRGIKVRYLKSGDTIDVMLQR